MAIGSLDQQRELVDPTIACCLTQRPGSHCLVHQEACSKGTLICVCHERCDRLSRGALRRTELDPLGDPGSQLSLERLKSEEAARVLIREMLVERSPRHPRVRDQAGDGDAFIAVLAADLDDRVEQSLSLRAGTPGDWQ